VREGLREQKVLEHTADYLVSPFDFVIPVYKDRGFADAPRWARHPLIFPIALRLGLWFYDRLGGRGRSKSKRRIDVAEMQRRFPRIKTDNLRHGVVYRDYQTDDARLTVMIVKTAVEHGAVAAGWMEATSVESDGSGGFVVTITDRLEGGEVAVRAKTVIAATGAFTPPTGTGDDPIPVVLSKGAHLVTPADAVGVTDSALVLPETEDERVMFVVPWLGRAVVGTTDTPYSGDPAHPLTDGDDTAYMLRHIHIYLDTPRFEPISAWSGLRALADPSGGDTSKASREHEITQLTPGYIQVAGGKLTGYRRIAEAVTSKAIKHLGKKERSHTADIALAGAGLSREFTRMLAARCSALGFPANYSNRLIERYGTRASLVLDIAAGDDRLRKPIGGGEWSLAETVYQARHEAAATVTDVIQRRTRLAWFTPDHARGDLAALADALGDELGWDDVRRDSELERVERDLAAEGL
ncbi:glycerol-3-phosphate dehydrogenase/oxidase, partial [bacterium]|nr:glycerol-3-phosphate dehydrogenase/oxidase [bacterium]